MRREPKVLPAFRWGCHGMRAILDAKNWASPKSWSMRVGCADHAGCHRSNTCSQCVQKSLFSQAAGFPPKCAIGQIRTSSHQLEIETGKFRGVPTKARICHLCHIERLQISVVKYWMVIVFVLVLDVLKREREYKSQDMHLFK